MKKIQPGNHLLIYLIGVLLILSLDNWFLMAGLFILLIINSARNNILARFPRLLLIILPFLLTAVILGLFRQQGGWNFSLLLLERLLLIAIWNHNLFYNFSENDLIKGLNQLRVPYLLTITILFIFSYYHLLKNEINQLKKARQLRGGQIDQNWFNISEYSIWGQIIGAGLIRSLERGDRVYQAMSLRGLKAQSLIQSQDRLKENWPIMTLSILIALSIWWIDWGIPG